MSERDELHRRLLVGQMEQLREMHGEGEINDREFERQYGAMTRALVGDETVDRFIAERRARDKELKRPAELGEQACDLCSTVATVFRRSERRDRSEPEAKFCLAHGNEDQKKQMQLFGNYSAEFRCPPNSRHLWEPK